MNGQRRMAIRYLRVKFYSDMAKMAREPAWLRCEMAKNAKT